jgi:hypothetical protein
VHVFVCVCVCARAKGERDLVGGKLQMSIVIRPKSRKQQANFFRGEGALATSS